MEVSYKIMNYYEFEIGKFANKLVREIFKLKPGEEFVITADTRTDPRLVDATAAAAFSVDAKPVVIWYAFPLAWGQSADPNLPVKVLSGALKEADAWVEFGILLFATPYRVAMRENKKLRYLCLAGSDVDLLVRNIGRVDMPTLNKLMDRTSEMLKKSKHIRFTTSVGTDIEFDMPKTEDGQHDPNYKVGTELASGIADKPGSHMMCGQLAFSPKMDTINGKLVLDGSLVYGNLAGGIIREPIILTIKAGEIVKVEGGREAKEFEKTMKSYNHPQMLRLAHTAIGLNPGAKLTGNMLEDERFWGSTEWGIGNIDPMLISPDGVDAPGHCDAICLNTSVYLDGKLFMKDSKFLIPELAEMAKKLGK